jgi:hypothetical protein
MHMNRAFAFLLLPVLLAVASHTAHAQVIAAATGHRFSLTAGATASAFQPDYQGGGVPQTSINRLYGVGGYVDVKFTRWFQAEAEGSWLKFNQYDSINQSNYLVGPRVPFHRIWRATPYAKVLFGFSNMNFEGGVATGRFTTIAYGGGVDFKLTKRISLRAFDFEYQQWPTWYNHQPLYPYGASAGVGYKIF